MAVKVREKPPGSGVWWVFIDHQGKRKAKKIGKDKKIAQDVAKKIEAQLTLNDCNLVDRKDKPKLPLFKDYADQWLEGYIKHMRRQSTYRRYREVLRMYVVPVIGAMVIDEIKRGDIRSLLLSLFRRGLSRSTVCLVRDVTSGVMGYALDEELVAVNPVAGITKRLNLGRDQKIHINPLNHDEVELFLGACRAHYLDQYPFFLCAFRTGMRLGELLALRWGDIDWNSKFIEVGRSYKLGTFTPTKTGRTRRVDMSDGLSLQRRLSSEGHISLSM
ncbi:MAG: tyrosine-type recombinase/integrase family protein [Deltaproteobacteria bacterium]|nr:tyrosine-type recombinase/integrase family protein [Deltaproteobacteria bacterium]